MIIEIRCASQHLIISSVGSGHRYWFHWLTSMKVCNRIKHPDNKQAIDSQAKILQNQYDRFCFKLNKQKHWQTGSIDSAHLETRNVKCTIFQNIIILLHPKDGTVYCFTCVCLSYHLSILPSVSMSVWNQNFRKLLWMIAF